MISLLISILKKRNKDKVRFSNLPEVTKLIDSEDGTQTPVCLTLSDVESLKTLDYKHIWLYTSL